MASWDGLEREAQAVYRRVGADPARGAAPTVLVEGMLGEGALRWADGDWLRAGGALVRIGDAWRVYLNRRHPMANLRFVALHELSHFVLGPGASEDDCDALAARLLAPQQAFELAIAHTARPRRSPARIYSDLGKWFRCTHSFAAMRYAEVTTEPVALISPERVRVRGAWTLPAEPRAILRLAASPIPGVRRTRLRDDSTRMVMRVR